jgi:hypothetical protein
MISNHVTALRQGPKASRSLTRRADVAVKQMSLRDVLPRGKLAAVSAVLLRVLAFKALHESAWRRETDTGVSVGARSIRSKGASNSERHCQ